MSISIVHQEQELVNNHYSEQQLLSKQNIMQLTIPLSCSKFLLKQFIRSYQLLITLCVDFITLKLLKKNFRLKRNFSKLVFLLSQLLLINLSYLEVYVTQRFAFIFKFFMESVFLVGIKNCYMMVWFWGDHFSKIVNMYILKCLMKLSHSFGRITCLNPYFYPFHVPFIRQKCRNLVNERTNPLESTWMTKRSTRMQKDRCSNPGRDISKSFMQVMTSLLLNVRKSVWLTQILGDDLKNGRLMSQYCVDEVR